jgi:hypothetical protein
MSLKEVESASGSWIIIIDLERQRTSRKKRITYASNSRLRYLDDVKISFLSAAVLLIEWQWEENSSGKARDRLFLNDNSAS